MIFKSKLRILFVLSLFLFVFMGASANNNFNKTNQSIEISENKYSNIKLYSYFLLNGNNNEKIYSSNSIINTNLNLEKNHITFDGIDDYVLIADADDLSVDTTGEMTISLWIRPDTRVFSKDESSGYVNFFGKGNTSGNYEWTFRIYSYNNTEGRKNRISFYVFNNEGGLGVGSYVEEDVVEGEWINIVAKIDKTNVYIYKNGVLKDFDPYYVGPNYIIPKNSEEPVRIGSRDLDSFFEGAIADVVIFNKALNNDEIKTIYNNGNKNFNFSNDSREYVSSKNLVAWYNLYESQSVLDLTSKGHDAVLITN